MEFGGSSRYEIIRQIGKGGMGSVYEAHDRLLGTRVAIKTFDPRSSSGLLYFKREFRSIAELRHPNLVRLFDLKVEGERWFFTMELVEGQPLHHYLRQHAQIADATTRLTVLPDEVEDSSAGWTGNTSAAIPIDVTGPVAGLDALPVAHLEVGPVLQAPACVVSDLLGLLTQILDALEALHSHDVIHCDLKPDNILITEHGEVKVVDFGIAQDLTASHWQDRVLGTALYMSPEQTRGQAVTPASDLYSLGVMIHTALTGKRLFDGNAVEVMVAHRTRLPPRLHTHVADLPSGLSDVVHAMLAKDPAERIGIADIRAALGLRASGKVDGAKARPRSVFVGRRQEVAALRACMSQALERRVQVALVQGESGAGKTSLAEAAMRTAEELGFQVARGRCYEREDVPFPAFDRLMDRLTMRLSDWSPQALEVWSESLEDAARLFPVFNHLLHKVHRPPPSPGQDPVGMRQRGVAGVISLLAALCTRSPMLLVIDDLQWSAPEDMELLSAILKGARRCPMMVLGTYQHEATEATHALRRFLRQHRDDEALCALHLGPLSQGDIQGVLVQVTGDGLPERALSSIAHQTGGNPLFVEQMAWMLAQNGPRRWDDRDALPDLEDIVRWRLDRLGGDARTLVEMASVAGGALSRATLAKACAMTAERFDAALDQALRAHLLRATSPEESAVQNAHIDLYHNLFREVAYRDLKPARHQALHLALARTLTERLDNDEHEGTRAAALEALYRHWLQAGQLQLAWQRGLEAAAEATRCLAFERAAQLYLDILGDSERPGIAHLTVKARPASLTPAVLSRVWEQLAEVLEFIGDYGGASWALAEALDCLSEGDEPPAVELPSAEEDEHAEVIRRLTLRLADDLVKTGQLESGLLVFERLLAPLGLRLVRSKLEATGLLATLRLMLTASDVLPERRHAITEAERYQLELFQRVFEAFCLVRPLYMTEALLRFQALARRVDDPAARAYDLTFEAAFVSMTSRREERFERSYALLDEADGWFEHTDLFFGPIYVQATRGYLAWLKGDLGDSQRWLEEALEKVRANNGMHLWEAFMARAWLMRTYHTRGRHAQAMEIAQALMREAGEQDVVRYGQAAWIAFDHHMQRGEVDDARALLAQWTPRVPEMPTHMRLMLGAAQHRFELVQDRLEGLPERVLAEADELDAAGCLYAYWQRALWHLPALEAAAVLHGREGLPWRLHQSIRRVANDLERHAPPWLSCQIARARALLSHADNEQDKAQQHILTALDLSRRAGAPYPRFRCLEAASRLGVFDEELHEELTDLALNQGYAIPEA